MASLVSRYGAVNLGTRQDLADGIASHRGLDGVLNVGHVQPIPGGLVPVHGEVEIGLADDAEQTQVFDALDVAHDVDDLVARLFQFHQVVAVDLDGQFALNAAHRLFHVVRNRL